MPLIPIDDEIEQGTVEIPIEDEKTPAEIHERGVSAVLVAKDRGENAGEAYMEATRATSQSDSDNKWTKNTYEARVGQIAAEAEYAPPQKIEADVTALQSNLDGDINQGNYVESIRSMPMAAGQKDMDVQREAVYMQMRTSMRWALVRWLAKLQA